MSKRCHYIQDFVDGHKGMKTKQWIYIPGCIGGANRGPAGCTCKGTEARLDRLEERLRLYHDAIRALRQDLRWLCGKVESGFAMHELRQMRLIDEAKLEAGKRWEIKMKTRVVEAEEAIDKAKEKGNG